MVFIFQEHWSVRQKCIPVLTFYFFATYDHRIFGTSVNWPNTLLNHVIIVFSYESHKLRPLPFHRQDLFGDNFYLESFWLSSPSQMCFHISLVTFWNIIHIKVYVSYCQCSINYKRDIKIFLNHTIIIFTTIICCITPRTIWIIIWISAIIIIIFLSETMILISNSVIAILPIAADFVA